MPSSATITAFYSFTATTPNAPKIIKSAEVNNNFSVFRGHIIPVDPTAASSPSHTYDLGAAGHSWRGVHNLYNTMYNNTASSVPATPSSGYSQLYFKDDGLLYKKNSSGVESSMEPSTGDLNVVLATSTYTASTSDDVILASGASFTVTTYSPTGASGAIIEVKKTDASLSNIIYVYYQSTYTTLAIKNESIQLLSDSSNWIPHRRHEPHILTDAGVISVTATTTAPTKSSATTDSVQWIKLGQIGEVYYRFDGTTGGLAGSGDYLYQLPSGMAFDSSQAVYTGTLTNLDQSEAQDAYIGYGHAAVNGGARGPVSLFAYSTTHFRVGAISAFGAYNLQGSAHFPFSSKIGFTFVVRARMANWDGV